MILKTDYVDLWQVHAVQNQDDIDKILSPGGTVETFEAAKKIGKCRFIGFTGHYDPEAHAALLNAYDKWDTVMMPVHAADHAYLSFEKNGPSRGGRTWCGRPGNQGFRQGVLAEIS